MRTASTLIRGRAFAEITGHTLIILGVHLGYRPFWKCHVFSHMLFPGLCVLPASELREQSGCLGEMSRETVGFMCYSKYTFVNQQIWAQNYNASLKLRTT